MEKKLSRWWYLPPIMLLGLAFYRPAEQIVAANGIAEDLTLKSVPLDSFRQLFDERPQMLTEEVTPNGKPQKDPIAYYRFVAKRKTWELKAQKRLGLCHRSNEWSRDCATLQAMLEQEQVDQTLTTVNAKYSEAFGLQEMQEAGKKFSMTRSIEPPTVPADYHRVWPEVRKAYWLAVLIYGLGILPIWITRRGMRVWYEIPRIVAASLTFFVSWFVYPIRLDQTRQARSALEFACGFLMLIFSFGTAAGSLAKAQTGGAFGGKSTSEEIKKKRRRATVVLSTSISSELPSAISGSIFNPAPNLQSSLTVRWDNGLYGSITQWKGLDHRDPNANLGDWLLGTAGYSRRFSRMSVTAEGTYANPAPLSLVCGDYAIFRATVAFPLGEGGKQGTVLGTVREVLKFNKGFIDAGTYGYLGYNRDVKVPGLPIPVATSSELRFDPGNIGRGAAVVLAERVELPLLPKTKRLSLRPFIGAQGPLWRERPVRSDNRSWELFGGLSLAFSFRI
ncbi:MAG: hypothetical protein ABSC29_04275 [Minisyncoccia bacterium]